MTGAFSLQRRNVFEKSLHTMNMEIKMIIKTTESNDTYYDYLLLLDNGELVNVGLSYSHKIWIFMSEDISKIEDLRMIYYKMLQSKECIDRIKFVFINPKDLIFIPSEMNDTQKWLAENLVRHFK